MSSQDVVKAILSGEASKLPDLFNTAMEEKIEVAMETMREKVSQKMFGGPIAEEVEEITEAQLDEAVLELEEMSDEDLTELARNTISNYITKSKDSADSDAPKRMAGRKLAKGKLATTLEAVAKELDLELDEETIDELSKKTLGSYINKAAGSAATHAEWTEKMKDKKPEWSKELQQKEFKRLKGVGKATDRLTKDPISVQNIHTGVKRKMFITKEDQDLDIKDND